jgi:GTPase SAR1 family protein
MRAVTCPYCFAVVPRQQIAFRCLGRAGRGPGCDPVLDQRLADYTGSAAGASLPPVFAAAGRKGRADCPACGRPTGRRVCPECHNPLPTAYCDTPGRIVALVGAKNAGKSTYIAVLLHELMNRIGTELDASLVACDDRTIDRYRRDFARPLFEERRLLATTASAATTPREPLVYLLTRTRRPRPGWPGRSRRRADTDALTLVLFDTAGEDLRSRDVRDLHLRYLEAADAIIFLVDPLDLPGARAALGDHAAPIAADDPGSEPINVIARVTEALSAGNRLRVPVAVALTKIDALQPSFARQSALHRARRAGGALDLDDREAVDEQVRAVLHDWQAGQLDRYLGQHYAEYALFGLSALGGMPSDGRVGAGGVRPYRVEDPLLWLLHRFGMLDGVRGRDGHRQGAGREA